jgi:hypothetical protein
MSASSTTPTSSVRPYIPQNNPGYGAPQPYTPLSEKPEGFFGLGRSQEGEGFWSWSKIRKYIPFLNSDDNKTESSEAPTKKGGFREWFSKSSFFEWISKSTDKDGNKSTNWIHNLFYEKIMPKRV